LRCNYGKDYHARFGAGRFADCLCLVACGLPNEATTDSNGAANGDGVQGQFHTIHLHHAAAHSDSSDTDTLENEKPMMSRLF
jgi:hypothetical protein